MERSLGVIFSKGLEAGAHILSQHENDSESKPGSDD
jgi:hypothetical protein